MAVKIRLARRGRKKSPFYHIVVADARAPRDGKFIEKIGIYNPMTKPATIDLDRDKAYEWLEKGAQPTETARAILKFKGVMYRKHLMRGVSKGSLTEEQAMEKYQAWVDVKESKVAERIAEAANEKREFLKKLSGEIKERKVQKVDEDTTAAFREQGTETLAEEVERKQAEAAAADASPTETTSEEVVEVVAETTEPVAEEKTEKVEEKTEKVVEKVAEAAKTEAPAEDAVADTKSEE